MSSVSTIQPQLLSQLNERSVLRVLQSNGPSSRAEVTRQLGVTAPTVSKAVASLLKSGLLEEIEAPEAGRGRPAKRLRLATRTAQVIGLVIDARQCCLATAGLEGALVPEHETLFDTPQDYEGLIEATVSRVNKLLSRRRTAGIQTLGLGISMPGLIDSREQRGILSPNVSITDGHSLGRDLSDRLGIPTVLLQECHALCLAEKHYGNARELDDFAMLDATTGVGLAVMSGGRLLTGHSGLAGELGHLPIHADGERCGCGRRGCLETLASDSALARRVSKRLKRTLSIEQIVSEVRDGRVIVSAELNDVLPRLAFALATVVNLFNPSTLFVFSHLLEIDESVFDRLIEQTGAIALKPSFDKCHIERARGNKREGAVAGIIEHLTASRVQSEESMM
jgi:predicted NBD/HSP70 family sugar kinase